MATKDPGSDSRKGARFDVSLPMRFTEDGENFSEGVVTSLSSIGLFVQTQRVPGLGSSIWFDLGLGGGLAPIRGRAKVGTLNRRFGTDVVTGFGVEFDSPREDIGAALAALEGVYPGAVRLETQGNLVWPIAPDPDRPDPGHEGDGLRIGTPDGWVGAGGESGKEAPAVAVGAALNRPIRDFLDMIRDLNGQILGCASERIPFAYQGRLLGPSTGVYKSTLVAGLIALDREEEEEAERRRAAEQSQRDAESEAVHEPPTVDVVATPVEGDGGEWTLDLEDLDVLPASPVLEPAPDAPAEPAADAGGPSADAASEASSAETGPAPITDPEAARGRVLLDLLAAQMRMIDDLACGGWRLEHMWNEQLLSIEQGSALLAESIERLAELSRATEATSGDETRELVTESLRGLDAVHTFLERVLWNARAFTPQEEVFRAYDDFVAEEKEAKSGARPAKERKKLFDTAAAPPSTARVKAKPQPVKIVLAVVLLAAAGVAAYFSTQSSRKILDSSKVHPPSTISVQAIADAFEKSNSDVRMAIDGISMEGAQARVTVPAEWRYKPKPVRQREFEALAAVLADKGFTSAVAVTSEGIERATWTKGVVSVVD